MNINQNHHLILSIFLTITLLLILLDKYMLKTCTSDKSVLLKRILRKKPRTDKKDSIFHKSKTLQEKCQLYNLEKHTNPTGIIKTYDGGLISNTSYITDIANIFPSSLIKYDFNNGILYCLSAKTGATNWNLLASVIRRNLTFSQFQYNYAHDFVYHDMMTLDVVNKISNMNKNNKFQGNLTNLSDKRYLDVRKMLDYYHFKTGRDENNVLLKLLFFPPGKGIDVVEDSQTEENNKIRQNDYTGNIKTSIILARNPFTRLYSSWSHRLSDINPLHESIFKDRIEVIKTYHTRESDKEPSLPGMLVTFTGFLRFVVTQHRRPRVPS